MSLSVEVVPPSTGGFSPIQELWVPGCLVSRAFASVTFRLRAASAVAPVLHTLSQPCFSLR